MILLRPALSAAPALRSAGAFPQAPRPHEESGQEMGLADPTHRRGQFETVTSVCRAVTPVSV